MKFRSLLPLLALVCLSAFALAVPGGGDRTIGTNPASVFEPDPNHPLVIERRTAGPLCLVTLQRGSLLIVARSVEWGGLEDLAYPPDSFFKSWSSWGTEVKISMTQDPSETQGDFWRRVDAVVTHWDRRCPKAGPQTSFNVPGQN